MLLSKKQLSNMNKLFSAIIFIFLASCITQADREVESTLAFAGDNRAELERVLEHYKDDAPKLRAARFLIAHMKDSYTHQAPEIDSLKALVRDMRASETRPDEARRKRWKQVDYRRYPKVYDAQVITADFLIENIELAFEAWQSRPWGKYYSFDDFCRYILPYRVGNEPLENWRKVYRDYYAPLLDSLYRGSDVIHAVDSIQHYLSKETSYYTTDYYLPHLGGLFLQKYKAGACEDFADYVVYIFRSLGIPIVKDTYFYSPATRLGHMWNAVKDTTGKFIPIEYKRMTDNRRGKNNRKRGKVYRQCTDRQGTPIFTGDYYMKDVTEEYYGTNRTEIPETEGGKDGGFIGVFSYEGWNPIGTFQSRDGKAVVENVEEGLVYMPLRPEAGKLRPCGYPFTVVGKGAQIWKPDTTQRTTVRLTRKYPISDMLKNRLYWLNGNRVEGSNRPDFTGAELLGEVRDSSLNLKRYVVPSSTRPFRYLKIKARPQWKLQLAEVKVFADTACTNELDYRIVKHSKPLYLLFDLRKADYIQDEDPLTYYMSEEKDAELVIDLGEGRRIGCVMLMPRNDDNFVRKGERYELFYQNGTKGWVSLGQQTATGDFIEFSQVPAGALLWLHNHTKGKEEQVFWWENGKQAFVGD